MRANSKHMSEDGIEGDYDKKRRHDHDAYIHSCERIQNKEVINYEKRHVREVTYDKT